MFRQKSLSTITFFGIVFAGHSALAYSIKDAKYVAGSASRAVLEYVVCLERNDKASPKKFTIQESLNRAIVLCQGLQVHLPKPPKGPDIQDLQMDILECGYKPGDASPDMGCAMK